jgi:hypothetical protein
VSGPRFDLIGGGGFGWVDRPMPRPKGRPELDSAIDGQGAAGDGGDAARRAAWIAGWRGVLKAIEAAPRLDLNRVDATGAPMTFGDAPRATVLPRRLIGRANPQAANRPRSSK